MNRNMVYSVADLVLLTGGAMAKDTGYVGSVQTVASTSAADIARWMQAKRASKANWSVTGAK